MIRITDAKAAELRALCENEQSTRLVKHYNFTCEAGPLQNCIEWQQLSIFTAAARTAIPDLLNERDRIKGLLDFQIEGEPYAYFTAWKERDAALARAKELIKERDRLKADAIVAEEQYLQGRQEEIIYATNMRDERDAALPREEVLRAALEFYADENSYESPPPYLDTLVREDRGSIARAALNASKKETGE